MRKRIKEYIENCFTCLMANNSSYSLEGETQLYPSPKTPLDILHLDHFGPLTETNDRHKHILVVIDAFTRFTWLIPTKTIATKEVTEALQHIFNTFGRSNGIVTDRGTAFTSREFTDFLSQRQIQHRKIAVASPWANGIAERVNRFLKNMLIKLINAPEDWKNHLRELQYIINNTYHSAVKSSPSKLLLGFEQRSHTDFKLSQFTKILTNVDTNLDKERDDSRDQAQKANDLLRVYNKQYRDKRSKKPTIYQEGEYVLVRNLRSKPRKHEVKGKIQRAVPSRQTSRPNTLTQLCQQIS